MATRYVIIGSAGGNGTEERIDGATAAHASLALWEDAADGTITEPAVVYCSTSNDGADGTVTINGWTGNSPTNTITIASTLTGPYAASGGRHHGKYNTTHYRIENAGDCLQIWESDLILVGLQTKTTNSANYRDGIVAGGGNITIDRCIIAGTTPAQGSTRGIFDDDGSPAGTTVLIQNTYVYGFNENVYYGTNATVTIRGCVVSNGGSRGILRNGTATITVTNCAVFNNGDDFVGTMTIDYCASDDGDGDHHVHLNENASGEWTAAFVDYTTADFHIKDTDSPLYNTGTDLFGSGLTTDIDGDTLSVRNDIGADEYVAAGGSILRQMLMHHEG